MFVHLHHIDTNESVVINTDYIVMVFENMYDESVAGASLTVSGHEGSVDVKESFTDIERLLNQDRVYSTLTTKCT